MNAKIVSEKFALDYIQELRWCEHRTMEINGWSTHECEIELPMPGGRRINLHFARQTPFIGADGQQPVLVEAIYGDGDNDMHVEQDISISF